MHATNQNRIIAARYQTARSRLTAGNGAVVSEYPLHTRPDKHTFPMRNRIIAAWSQGLVVVECPDKSGALITANLAAEYGRPVFAVPGPIDRKHFTGSHRLIRDGAILITDGAHVVEDLGGMPDHAAQPKRENTESSAPKNGDQSKIMDALGQGEMTVDELLEICGLPASAVSRHLAMLEISGMVSSCPGARYVRKPARTT